MSILCSRPSAPAGSRLQVGHVYPVNVWSFLSVDLCGSFSIAPSCMTVLADLDGDEVLIHRSCNLLIFKGFVRHDMALASRTFRSASVPLMLS